jgi:hypothetical protein
VTGANAELSGLFFDPPAASPAIAATGGRSAGAQGSGMTTLVNSGAGAIGALDFGGSNAAAVAPTSVAVATGRGLVYDLALEQVSTGIRRTRSGFIL